MKIDRPPSKQAMPDNAQCVFKGIIYDIYQWPQRLYDGSTHTYEKIKRSCDGTNVIPVTTEGKIIVTRQQQPGYQLFYGMPGGMIDPGEQPDEAAARELLEETGYQAASLELFNALQPVSKMDWAVYTFIAHGCEKVAEQNLEPGEKIELQLVTVAEFIELIKDPTFRDSELALKILRMGERELGEFKGRVEK